MQSPTIQPVLSLITAVADYSSRWLGETERSVARARAHLADPAAVEWIVVADGANIAHPEGADAVVRWATRRGVSAARSLGAARANGRWIMALDSDDLVDPNGLRVVAQICGDQAGLNHIGWFGFNRTLLDGSPTPHWFDAPAWVPAGVLALLWDSPFLFHPNSMVVRRDLLLQVGGWPSCPVNEDLALALLISEVADGYLIPEPVVRYRVWDGQLVAAAEYLTDKSTAFDLISAVLDAARAYRGRPPAPRPVPGVAHGRLARGEDHG